MFVLRKKQKSIDLNAYFAFNILANLFVGRDQVSINKRTRLGMS